MARINREDEDEVVCDDGYDVVEFSRYEIILEYVKDGKVKKLDHADWTVGLENCVSDVMGYNKANSNLTNRDGVYEWAAFLKRKAGDKETWFPFYVGRSNDVRCRVLKERNGRQGGDLSKFLIAAFRYAKAIQAEEFSIGVAVMYAYNPPTTRGRTAPKKKANEFEATSVEVENFFLEKYEYACNTRENGPLRLEDFTRWLRGQSDLRTEVLNKFPKNKQKQVELQLETVTQGASNADDKENITMILIEIISSAREITKGDTKKLKAVAALIEL